MVVVVLSQAAPSLSLSLSLSSLPILLLFFAHSPEHSLAFLLQDYTLQLKLLLLRSLFNPTNQKAPGPSSEGWRRPTPQQTSSTQPALLYRQTSSHPSRSPRLLRYKAGVCLASVLPALQLSSLKKPTHRRRASPADHAHCEPCPPATTRPLARARAMARTALPLVTNRS